MSNPINNKQFLDMLTRNIKGALQRNMSLLESDESGRTYISFSTDVIRNFFMKVLAILEQHTAEDKNVILLNELQGLVDSSDCIEDQCGLDAELLRHNVLRRIAELEKQTNPNQGDKSE